MHHLNSNFWRSDWRHYHKRFELAAYPDHFNLGGHWKSDKSTFNHRFNKLNSRNPKTTRLTLSPPCFAPLSPSPSDLSPAIVQSLQVNSLRAQIILIWKGVITLFIAAASSLVAWYSCSSPARTYGENGVCKENFANTLSTDFTSVLFLNLCWGLCRQCEQVLASLHRVDHCCVQRAEDVLDNRFRLKISHMMVSIMILSDMVPALER